MSAWKSAFKWITIISLLFLAIPIRIPPPPQKIQFDEYIKKFNKTYEQGSEEYDKRYRAFRHTLALIDKLNTDRIHNETAKYGLTKFSDLTETEFIEFHLDQSNRLAKKHQRKHKHKHIHKDFTNFLKLSLRENGHRRQKRQLKMIKDVPLKVDWREKGIISPVIDQGLCGACWAYSTINTIEALAAENNNNSLVRLSVQQSIDCARGGNYGCLGGDICALLEWLTKENVTVATEEDYPTSGKREVCHKSKTSSGIRVKDFACGSLVDIEDQLIQWIALRGPVAVAINALSWQNYLGGIIQYHCPSDLLSLNHAVQIVGYDLTHELPYYIVKNSWGPHFGLDGYLHLAIGSNICGIVTEVAIITLK